MLASRVLVFSMTAKLSLLTANERKPKEDLMGLNPAAAESSTAVA